MNNEKIKIIAVGLISALLGAGVFAAQDNIRRAKEQLHVPPVGGSESIITLGENQATHTKKNQLSDTHAEEIVLKAEAMHIAGEPFVAKDTTMNVSAIQDAQAKMMVARARILKKYDDSSAWLELGAYRSLVGDTEGAILAWKFLAKIRPDLFVAWYDLGDTYAFKLHNFLEGEKYFEKSIEANPLFVDGYLALATLYKNKEEGFDRTMKIEEILKKGITRNGSNITLKVRLAEYYRDTGKKDEAIVAYEEVLKLNPPNRAAIEAEITALKAV